MADNKLDLNSYTPIPWGEQFDNIESLGSPIEDAFIKFVQKQTSNLYNAIETKLKARLKEHGYEFSSRELFLNFVKHRITRVKQKGFPDTLYLDDKIPLVSWWDTQEVKWGHNKVTVNYGKPAKGLSTEHIWVDSEFDEMKKK